MTTAKPKPILVVGNAVLDIILGVDHTPHEDEEMRATSRRTDLGGNAANTARVLAALGHPVTLLARLAMDSEAEALRRLLMDAGVETRHLVRDPQGHTPVSTILLSAANGARTIVHHRELAELEVEDFLALPLRQYAWIHFEGRNVEAVQRMLDHLADMAFAGRISVEIEKPRPGIEKLASRADLALTCQAYARAKGFADAPALLSALGNHAGRAMLTCTWGEAGAWARVPSGAVHHSPAFVPPKVVDTVGAGDVFNAGMIHALMTDAPGDQALATATHLAGRKVGLQGFTGLVTSAATKHP